MEDEHIAVNLLKRRVLQLEQQLRQRPTNQQIEWVQDYCRRREALYEAVLARNVILNERLRLYALKAKKKGRTAHHGRPTTQEGQAPSAAKP